jgi:GNAT superfamily N-acetyltransferase
MFDFYLVEDSKDRAAVAEKVLRDLPEWFGIEESTVSYIEAARDLPMIVACPTTALKVGPDAAVGFVSIEERYPFAAEIHSMGVLREWHGHGAGTELVRRAAERAKWSGRRLLTVKTLSPRHPDAGYARTRRFYERVGFFPYEENLDIWGESNPCLMMAMVV